MSEMISRGSKNNEKITQDMTALKGRVNTLESQFNKVKEAQSDLDERRKNRHTLAKSGNAVQTFAANFKDFLDAYSGVRGIADAADAQYGGLVTEALSLLLMVFIRSCSYWPTLLLREEGSGE